jgi:hypothetical protein
LKLPNEKFVIFVVSTMGQGEVPDTMRVCVDLFSLARFFYPSSLFGDFFFKNVYPQILFLVSNILFLDWAIPLIPSFVQLGRNSFED